MVKIPQNVVKIHAKSFRWYGKTLYICKIFNTKIKIVMKKKLKLFILASLAIIVLAAIFTLTNSMFTPNRLLAENLAALADDPIDWEEEEDGDGGDGGGGANKFADVTCSTITYVDPTTGIVMQFQFKLCEGSGKKKCKC